ncbi:MAG: DNA mismatch repair endonuclease MutL [Desulfohalobiaceae bacterium]
MTQQSQIRILPENLQNQIAAGEVVERPASVLKELLENSLDAGASSIQAWIEQGGQSLILVQDNGWGLPRQEISLALCRHATSKIQESGDLARISSFGFRGEALPSIASVSRLSISSIQPGEQEGFKVQADFGEISEETPVPLRQGTRVEVRDLFLNTPARLKFLKTRATEARKCQEILQQYALVHWDKELRLYFQDRLNLEFLPAENLMQRLQCIWPEQITQGLQPVEHGEQGLRISGLVGGPENAQAKPGRIHFYVNQRPVQSRLLQSALKQAYQGRLLAREHPQAVLFLELDPELVDVNVHPAKLEVRFRDEQSVFRLLYRAVARALDQAQTEHFPAGRPQPEAGQDPGRKYKFKTFEEFLDHSWQEDQGVFSTEKQEPDIQAQILPGQSPGSSPEEAHRQSAPQPQTSPELQGHAYLGQLDRTYLLLLEQERTLLCLDQHAMHERVLFNSFRQGARSSSCRRLAPALELSLHQQERAPLEQAAMSLRRMGFAFSRPDRNKLLLEAVPDFMSPQEGKSFLRQVLQERLESLDGLWTALACRQAVKAGELLSPEEACQLIQAWLKCESRSYCPHGRPVMIALGSKDLAGMFKRS